MRIALIYGALILFITIGGLVFFNLALKNNLKNSSIIEGIVPRSSVITIKSLQSDALEKTPHYQGTNGITEELSIYPTEFNQLVSKDIIQRTIFISFFALIVIIIITLSISYYISFIAMKPISIMSKNISKLTPQNMDIILQDPKTCEEVSNFVNVYNSTLKRLKSAFTDLERFNSYASHELRNSLAILKAKIELGCDHNELNDYVNNVKTTIDDILALSSKQVKDKGEEVDMAYVIAKAVDEYSQTGRKIFFDMPEEGVSTIIGKEIWLYRCICNLIDNSVKYSDSKSPIYINITEKYKTIMISIKDRGKGISKEEQEVIWKPYYSSSKENSDGHGLGLALVKHVVDMSGGIVWVESEINNGSTFFISIPVSLS